MATTTNYGWTTPDDTALVKDGASAIRTLGSSVDTTTKNLNPETTLGDLSFRSSTSNVNTRIPIGSSGQHLTVVAGVPAWATASDQTPLTTKGDLLGFSTLDARIPIGANGTLLTADSTETLGLKWAAIPSSGLTLIDEIPFTSTNAVNCDNVFTSTYKNYKIILVGKNVADNNNVDITFKMRASGSATSSNYSSQRINAGSTSITTSSNAYGTDEWYGWTIAANNAGDTGNHLELYYPQLSSYTTYSSFARSQNNEIVITAGGLADTTAYDGIGFLFSANSTGAIFIYGYGKE